MTPLATIKDLGLVAVLSLAGIALLCRMMGWWK